MKQRNKLGIVMPVRGAHEYTDQIIPQLVRELVDYLYDIPVSFVVMDSEGHEEFKTWQTSVPAMKALNGLDQFSCVYEKVEDPANTSLYKIWNRGVELADADNIIFINNDILMIPRAFYDMYLVLEEKKFNIVVPAQVTTKEDVDSNQFNPHTNVGLVEGFILPTGWCFGFTNEFWESIGKFNENYRLWFGDTEMFIRADRRKVGTVTSAGIFHYFSRSIQRMPREQFVDMAWADFRVSQERGKELGVIIDARTDEQYDSMLKNYVLTLDKMK